MVFALTIEVGMLFQCTICHLKTTHDGYEVIKATSKHHMNLHLYWTIYLKSARYEIIAKVREINSEEHKLHEYRRKKKLDDRPKETQTILKIFFIKWQLSFLLVS